MIFFGQMLGGQRGPEARLPGAAPVLLPNQAQDLFAKSVRLGAVGGTTGTAVLQPRSPFEPVTPPQTLGLPVTQRRSEERRVGKECRSRRVLAQIIKKSGVVEQYRNHDKC